MRWNNADVWDFTARAIRERALAVSGVYYVRNEDRYILIGESANIRETLLGHLNGDVPCIQKHKARWFGFEQSPPNSRIKRRDELIAECHPVCKSLEQ